MSFLSRVVRLLSPGVPAAILPGGSPKGIIPQAPAAQISSTVAEFKERAKEDVVTAIEIAPVAAALYTGGTSMSIFSTIAELGSSYLNYRASRNVAQPIQMSGPSYSSMTSAPPYMQTMGAMPGVMRALPSLGAVGGLVVTGARAAMRSAQVYCRRHPAWCAQIGGTAAIMAMIESGQLPPIKRRRGRGITPRDLRSFRRVANLVRGYCPTVRRIPTRQLHVRGTGITHA